MTLRKKTLSIVGATLAGLMVILYSTSRVILLRSFAGLEEQNAHENVQRVLSALLNELETLDRTASDYANWDDTYHYIVDANPHYIKSNFGESDFTELRLNFLLLIDTSGRVVFGKAFDLHSNKEAQISESFHRHVFDRGLLLRHFNSPGRIGGIVLLPEDPVLVVSRPILTSEGKGPVHGTLIMGRNLDAAEIQRLAETTHLTLTVKRFNELHMPPDLQWARASLSKKKPILLRPLNANTIAGYALLEDIYSEPCLMLKVEMPRAIYAQGQASLFYFITSLLVVGLVFGMVTLLLLEKAVLSRLTRLSANVVRIGASGDHSARVSLAGRDELSSLASAMNKMLEALGQSQQTLRESQERLRTVVTSAPIVLWALDRQGVFTLFEGKGLEMMGLKTGEVVGQSVFEVYRDVPQILENNRRALSGESFTSITEVAGLVFESRYSPLRDPAQRDEIIGVIGVAIDITERKRAGKKINMLAHAARSISECVVITDMEDNILFVNDAFLKTYGYDEHELIGKLISVIRSPNNPPEVAQGILAATLRGGWQGELLNRRKGGSEFPVFLSTSVVRDEDGQPLALTGVSTDITERKQAEAELQKAKEAAEAATQAKSAFLANMSHEIRTPMNGVIGMTGLLLDTELTSEQRDFVETIRSSGDALLTIINDILDFSKIESGKLELERQSFNLRDCIEESLDLLATRATAKRLELAYLMDDRMPSVLIGDVTRLRQILINLLSNAVKFTERGEVVVEVMAGKEGEREKGGKGEWGKGREGELETLHPLAPSPLHPFTLSPFPVFLHFSVRDTGIGIPKDRLDRLFKSFSQVDASTTRQYGGTGLGLAISKRLSELMGGTMWVESEVGKGSIFHFTIVAEAAPNQSGVDLDGVQPQLAGKRLLIVDDNATNRRILSGQAGSWGMLSRQTASGGEALAWIRQGEPFDIAILDMQMPEMDGITLAGEIRKHRPEPSALPLVMLTSLGLSEPEVNAARHHFQKILTKPVKQSRLYDVLISIFATTPAVAESAARPAPRPYFSETAGRSAPAAGALFSARYPLRILLAEDNAVNQKVALRLLQKIGYRAEVAANGVEVLEALRRQPFDVVLMDVQMPEMDGFEATRRIRQQWHVEQQPRIIAMTANAMQGDRERCLEAGMDDYVSKPVHIEELMKALSKSQAREATPSTVVVVPETESEPSAVLDAQVLEKFREMMGEEAQEFFTELIDIYLKESPKLMEELRAAIQAKDAGRLSGLAHSLKSSSANLGAKTLADSFQELEISGRIGSLERAGEILSNIDTEFLRVKTALEEQR